MFSTLTSIPLTLASSTSSFLSNRKKTFAYLGATVGGAYAVGQWGLQRMMEASERGRKQTGAKNDLLNRFNLNLQDAQFTVLALLPTVATQLQTRLDVEDRTAQLGEIAKGERQAKLRESERMRKETAEREEAERLRIQEEEDKVKQEQEAVEKNGEEKAVNGNESSSQEAPVEIVANGEKTEQQAPSAVEESTRHPSKPTLNPAAPAFQPRFAPSTPPQDDFPKLNGHSSDSETAETQSQIANGTSSEPETLVEHEGVETLGKSWAEVVKTDKEEETAVNGEAATEETGTSEAESPSQAVDAAEEISGPAMTSEPEEPVKESTTAEKGSSEVAEPEPAAPPAPTKSKVQLWNEIKILSFTRLLTSIYVLSLLTLQTHVQLALLGRAHYVKSLIDALPPRSPSPTSSSSFTLPSSEKGKEEAEEPTVFNEEEDLEAALYKAKAVPQTREEDRVSEDVERKYLTFSWWLLHEGWKVVQDRVQEKVEEVVGPMGLKTPVVYGELSALLGEIRRRIETQPDGTRFDFAAALHPPTPSGELLTLVTGGGFPAPPPSSSPSSSSLISPPLRSLLNETSDFLLSPDGSLVLTLVLDRLLSLSVSKLEPAFSTPIPPTSASLDGDGGARGARFEDVTEKQTRLASLLPVLTRLTAAGLEGQAGILRGGHGNEFVDAIDDIRELKEFVAIVYASYDRDNLRASYYSRRK